MENLFATKVEQLEDCTPKKLSFFALVGKVWEGGNPAPLHRLCTLMRKMEAGAILVESVVPNKELNEELEMAQKRLRSTKVVLNASRLTFFYSCPVSRSWEEPKDLPADQILGYAVVVTIRDPRRYKTTYLLEAVVRPPSIVIPLPEDKKELDKSVRVWPITNCYVHNTRMFSTHVGPKGKERKFKFDGAFFTQQNNLTHVCAHAALRTAINSSPEFGAQKLTNKKINEILGIDFSSPSKSVGKAPRDPDGTKEGLSAKEIEKVANSLGGVVDVANFTEKVDIEYDQYIYPILESGYPVILGIEGWDVRGRSPMAHVVAVLGHTLNSDRWNPQARIGYGSFPLEPYIPVTAWCDHYVVSDDNFGMFVTLPSDMVRNYINPTKNPSLHASLAVTILPKKVKITGYVAEEVAAHVAKVLLKKTSLSSKIPWLECLKAYSENNNLICRTMLVSAKEYREHIKNIEKMKKATIPSGQKKRIGHLRDYVWVTEISISNIYDGNKHKLGDVVIRASATQKEHAQMKSLFMAWFPGFVFFYKGMKTETWFIEDHVPFLRSKKRHLLEW